MTQREPTKRHIMTSGMVQGQPMMGETAQLQAGTIIVPGQETPATDWKELARLWVWDNVIGTNEMKLGSNESRIALMCYSDADYPSPELRTGISQAYGLPSNFMLMRAPYNNKPTPPPLSAQADSPVTGQDKVE